MSKDEKKYCATCKHFEKMNTQIIGAQKMGECRESPPCVFSVQQGLKVAYITKYPDVSDVLEACSKHEEMNA